MADAEGGSEAAGAAHAARKNARINSQIDFCAMLIKLLVVKIFRDKKTLPGGQG
jgi:hypothetical protein